jgi:hypothetical protein
MAPEVLMHTAPLNVPGSFSPAVSLVTEPKTFSADGFDEAVFEYPGHFLALVEVVEGAPIVVVLSLTQVMVPPLANEVAANGLVDVPVLAVPESLHPLTVMLPETFPVMVEHVTFPFGPPLAKAWPPLSATKAADAGMAAAATNINTRRILPPSFLYWLNGAVPKKRLQPPLLRSAT